ncbi:hypothetical protein [Streptomyces poriticola]|uniref:hypothetical protein n=1 Tax=Streptomyces poriticola TaxID=3120506 RepID=UPI002FCDFBEC
MSDGHGGRRHDAADDRHEDRPEDHLEDHLEDHPVNHSHAGNGTVNHGPDPKGPDAQGPDAQGSAAQRPAGLDGPGRLDGPAGLDGSDGLDELGGLDPDELALRRILHDAVRDVQPQDGTLEYLRRAVPARRARKRQAAVGLAAAVLFVGTAVPALVHVSNSGGSGANPSVAGHASQAQGGVSSGKDPAGGKSDSVGSTGRAEDKGRADAKEKEKDEKTGGPDSGATAGADPSASSADGAPACAAGQLGPAVASSAAPDSTGVVYGSFLVTNVSSAGCTVAGPGAVTASPKGAADANKIGTARHVAGDAAAGLPDPSLELPQLLLEPGAAYEVQFAWVPTETCPTAGGGGTGGTTGGSTGGPSPDPSPTQEPTTTEGATAGEGDDGGTAPQLVTEDGLVDGSVAVTYTPEGGTGSATATVSDACAGTVHWTGVLAAQ